MSFQLPAGFRPANPPQGGGAGGGQGPSDEERQAQAAQAAQREEMKRSMIQTMLEPEARERRECHRGRGCAQLRGFGLRTSGRAAALPLLGITPPRQS